MKAIFHRNNSLPKFCPVQVLGIAMTRFKATAGAVKRKIKSIMGVKFLRARGLAKPGRVESELLSKTAGGPPAGCRGNLVKENGRRLEPSCFRTKLRLTLRAGFPAPW